jgi:hypothetical protein
MTDELVPAPTAPADTLRRAAALLREHATAATPGPWRQHDTHLGALGGHTATVLSGERNTTELRAWLPSMSQEPWDEQRNVWADAAYMALMHPGVGAALAELLETEAAVADDLAKHRPEMTDEQIAAWVHGPLAIARQLLGEGE